MFLAFLLAIVVGVSLSFFLGSAAVSEKLQFSIVFAAGGLRLAGLMSLILFVVFYIRRSFEDRDVEYMLSRPISRPAFIIAHAFSFSVLAIVFSVCVSLAIFLMFPKDVMVGQALWSFSLMMEYIVMVNVALFFSMVLPSASVSSMAILGLYVLGRMIGQILGIVATSKSSGIMFYMEQTINFISVFIPRFDLMGQTTWLVYGAGDSVGYTVILFQGLIFSLLFVVSSMIDLVRRQF